MVGRTRREPGTEVRAGDPADEERTRHGELHVAEQDVTERRRGDERDRLHEVGAHELCGGERGIEEEECDDHQRARPDRRDANHEAADDPDDDRGERAYHYVVLCTVFADGHPASLLDDGPRDHRRSREQQREPEEDLEVGLDAVTERLQDERTAEGCRN